MGHREKNIVRNSETSRCHNVYELQYFCCNFLRCMLVALPLTSIHFVCKQWQTHETKNIINTEAPSPSSYKDV